MSKSRRRQDENEMAELFASNPDAWFNEMKMRRADIVDLVDAGYRKLATKMHPDVGGSTEDMARLTRVRDRLKKVMPFDLMPPGLRVWWR
jgi:hypothetical protein